MNKKEKRTGKITPVKKHLARGYCCGSGCKMCPYAPKHKEGTTKINNLVILKEKVLKYQSTKV